MDGWMRGSDGVNGGWRCCPLPARPTDRNAPSRRTPPGNQARFICNNPVTRRRRRHYSDVLLLSSGTKATPTSAAGDDEELFLNRRSSATAVRSSQINMGANEIISLILVQRQSLVAWPTAAVISVLSYIQSGPKNRIILNDFVTLYMMT